MIEITTEHGGKISSYTARNKTGQQSPGTQEASSEEPVETEMKITTKTGVKGQVRLIPTSWNEQSHKEQVSFVQIYAQSFSMRTQNHRTKRKDLLSDSIVET